MHKKTKSWLGGVLAMFGAGGARKAMIFPALFVEPVRTTWAMPAAHYDPQKQIAVRDDDGRPAFGSMDPQQMASSSSSSSETDSQMGINRGTDDHTHDSDTDD